MTNRRSRAQRWPLARSLSMMLTGVVVAAALLLLGASPSSAHTGFESSTPADQAIVEQPVEVVTIVFTGAAKPVGDGFVALNSDGVVQQPVSVSTPDDQVFTVLFDPPLAGGAIGVRWNVQAADAHPIEGAFSFTVTAPAATTTTSTESASTTTIPVGTGTQAPAAVVADTASPTTDAPGVTAAVSSDAGDATGSGAVPATVQSLDDFLAVDGSVPGETTALVGRILSLVGVALTLGGIAFVFSVLRGTRGEVRMILSGAAVLAGVLVVGAAIEYIGDARIGSESIGSEWSTQSGVATVLRLVGGLALIVGIVGTIRRGEDGSGDGLAHPRALSAAVVEEGVAVSARRGRSDDVARWVPTAQAWPVALGAAAILVSFWFDGHTVTRGFRPLHAVVNTVHVAAGSVWVGGVVALCAVVWSRRRESRPTRSAELVLRFSRIATLSLGAVVVAGGLMAFIVLDSVGDLTRTEWGQTLLLKTAAVMIAVGVGAYNHFRMVPALDAEPDSERLRSQLRSTVTVEAIILVFVVVVTAWLIAADTFR